jgi:hypothetical protein
LAGNGWENGGIHGKKYGKMEEKMGKSWENDDLIGF